MPQITVTIDDASYLELIHHLPKGMKSKFVNAAIIQAIKDCTWWKRGSEVCVIPGAMHQYAKDWGDIGPWVDSTLVRMHERLKLLPEEVNWYSKHEAASHPNQTKLGVEEE